MQDFSEYPARIREHYKARIAAKMFNESAQNLSDAEIERSLNGCVGKTKLTYLAKELRDAGELVADDIL